MVSHAIAHLTNWDFVSLHRDSESAQKSLAQLEKNISLIGKIKRPRKEKDGAQKNKTTATILTARLFLINKSNETKTPSLETSRFAKYFF